MRGAPERKNATEWLKQTEQWQWEVLQRERMLPNDWNKLNNGNERCSGEKECYRMTEQWQWEVLRRERMLPNDWNKLNNGNERCSGEKECYRMTKTNWTMAMRGAPERKDATEWLKQTEQWQWEVLRRERMLSSDWNKLNNGNERCSGEKGCYQVTETNWTMARRGAPERKNATEWLKQTEQWLWEMLRRERMLSGDWNKLNNGNERCSGERECYWVTETFTFWLWILHISSLSLWRIL